MTDQPRSASPARVLLPLGLGTALSLMGDATLYAVLPTHTAEAGISMAGVGIILGVNRAIRLLTNGPAGLAYDRYARRPLFVSSLFLGALSTALYGATRGFGPLFVARLLWGLSWSGIWVGGATMILDVTVQADRGRWTGVYQIWFFLGSALGSLLGGVLTDAVGYRATMWIGAVLTCVGAVAALLFLPETRFARCGVTTARYHAPLLPLRANGPLWGAIILQGINRFTLSGVLSATLALVVSRHVGSLPVAVGAASATGILLSSRTVFSMVAAPFCGSLSDRLGSRWGMMAVSVLAGLIGFALLALGTVGGLVAGVVFTAFASGGIQSLATALTGDLVTPGQRGQAIGLLHTVGDAGSALGPPLAYALMPFLSLGGVYVLCAGFFGLGMILAGRYHRRQRE